MVVLSSYPQRHYWSTDHTAVESLLLFCLEKVWKLINRKFRSEIKECNICLSEISNQALAREKQWSLKVLKKKMSAFRLMLPKLVLSLRISHGSVSINISSLCLLFRSSHISLDWTQNIETYVSVKAKHLEGSIFMDCGSDLGSARHVPGKGVGVASSVYTSVLISLCFKMDLRLIE